MKRERLKRFVAIISYTAPLEEQKTLTIKSEKTFWRDELHQFDITVKSLKVEEVKP